MKKIVLIGLLLIIVMSIYAQNSGTGLGIILGEPTGLSAKLWTGKSTAFDAAAAWSFGDEGALHIHADMLWHNFGLINQQLPVYYGIGVRVKLADDPNVGIRVPIGIAYQVSGAPLDIFLEVVPILDLMPETDFGFNGALGVRYFF
ncbi:MAG: hypothetical protein K9M95_04185 [Candidatus Cloacimonetes bacterium]|nr:hypothetical protein [Candidatus Cloacimonadota bacterium]MCF7815321.1 hypothetical protein [Candidatus Cloacimonadota bacterium]MCF7883308.1 hypothetical protein [Candidatus Cloacimonadota bacterium]